MKAYLIVNLSAMEEHVADAMERNISSSVKARKIEEIVLGSKTENFSFENTAHGAPRTYFTEAKEAETHMDFLCVKYPHLTWGLMRVTRTAKADVPIKNTVVKS